MLLPLSLSKPVLDLGLTLLGKCEGKLKDLKRTGFPEATAEILKDYCSWIIPPAALEIRLMFPGVIEISDFLFG